MATSNIEDFEKGNAAFVEAFDQDTTGALAIPPQRKALVLACMDARLHPEKVLGLEIGDAHVVRNAGGRASADALRSIAISQRLLGTQEVVVIHHTDCGMLTFKDDDIRSKIRDELGDSAGDAADGIAFLPFSDLEASVKADIRIIKEAAIVDGDVPVHGFVYDVTTGRLNPVN
ncbi:carbonic anhydrase [Monoraphidium neglectum]|uniref:Carbonic anhydrase n=1 Tax=Monoraphidium neglectum TaxID=145388 RepID=A0A0D2KAH1_9CHLO|nr:carbonic anhydrase [Monoraphidium neglectum]KIZ07263.1 carbonic anhydrase [Monoraphidium neglectum]|eukprot:XP_013906282.1 carbonic anhydrase [Monoraphidium neglectum]